MSPSNYLKTMQKIRDIISLLVCRSIIFLSARPARMSAGSRCSIWFVVIKSSRPLFDNILSRALRRSDKANLPRDCGRTSTEPTSTMPSVSACQNCTMPIVSTSSSRRIYRGGSSANNLLREKPSTLKRLRI